MNENKLRKLFADANINYDEIQFVDDLAVVDVDGDWKHSHLYCDYLMEKHLGYKLLYSEVTEEDGSDWYRADRVYKKVAR